MKIVTRYSTPRHVAERLRFAFSQVRLLKKTPAPVDVMVVFCNHFEGPSLSLRWDDVERWVDGYPRLVAGHRDADGRPPRHTWFVIYADDTDNVAVVRTLSELCRRGYGEIELHLHHGRGFHRGRPARNMFPEVEDDAALRRLLRRAVEDFSQAGALVTAGRPSQVRYAVIHGAWALDNSRWMPGYHGWCGVNSELDVLKSTGCFADFTFPAWGTMQPAKINSIYYAKDDPGRPKSYNTGVDLRVGGASRNDLVIFEGPAADSCDISHRNPPSPARVDAWIRSWVHVKGRPNWIFVKIHTHGCESELTTQMLLGEPLQDMFAYLEKRYNDGSSFRLHYVTAREAYNIAKAAEAGMDGNPGDFRDFLLAPYQNSHRR